MKERVIQAIDQKGYQLLKTYMPMQQRKVLGSYRKDIYRILQAEFPTIACDFDGTITYIDHPDGRQVFWPEIGDIRPGFVKCFHKAHDLGFKWSLNTLRHDEPLKNALNTMAKKGIVFDTVCENHWYLVHKWGDCRKIAGDFYFEDRTFPPLDMDKVWEAFYEWLLLYEPYKKLKDDVRDNREHLLLLEVA